MSKSPKIEPNWLEKNRSKPFSKGFNKKGVYFSKDRGPDIFSQCMVQSVDHHEISFFIVRWKYDK